jgi:hypothetical protein
MFDFFKNGHAWLLEGLALLGLNILHVVKLVTW